MMFSQQNQPPLLLSLLAVLPGLDFGNFFDTLSITNQLLNLIKPWISSFSVYYNHLENFKKKISNSQVVHRRNKNSL